MAIIIDFVLIISMASGLNYAVPTQTLWILILLVPLSYNENWVLTRVAYNEGTLSKKRENSRTQHERKRTNGKQKEKSGIIVKLRGHWNS